MYMGSHHKHRLTRAYVKLLIVYVSSSAELVTTAAALSC